MQIIALMIIGVSTWHENVGCGSMIIDKLRGYNGINTYNQNHDCTELSLTD